MAESAPHNDLWNAFADVFIALLGALGTFFFVFDRFGVAGALFVIGLFLFIACCVHSVRRRGIPLPRKLGARLSDWASGSDRTSRVLLGLCLLSWLVAVSIWGYGIADVRFFRREFTLFHDHIALANVDDARQAFDSKNNSQSHTQRSAEEEAMFTWVGWMIGGANRTFLDVGKDNEEREIHQQLFYVESQPFDGRYTHINSFASVAEGVKIVDGVAFLFDPVSGMDSESETSRWSKPAWRQMFLEVEKKFQRTAKITVSNPNPGDRLVLFLRLEPDDGKTFPMKEQIIPSHEIGVRR